MGGVHDQNGGHSAIHTIQKKTKMLSTSKQNETNCAGAHCHGCDGKANTQ